MSTYITLLKFTQKGIEDIKNGPARLDAAKELFKDIGAEITSFHLTVGRFDAVVVTECKDDETMAKVVLTIGQKGNVTTETLRAFTEDEYKRIVSTLP